MSEPSAVTSVESTSAMAPVQPTRRIATIDVLRGFTLLGILVANMAFYAFPMAVRSQGAGYWTDPIDKAAQLLIMFTAVGEFYVPFSFFFGWGMALQMGRAAARGTRYVPLYLRRLLVLFLMGLAHATLLWTGDILMTYATLGLLLILFRKIANRAILVVAVICLIIPCLLYLPGPSAGLRQSYEEAIVDLRREAYGEDPASVYAQGDYQEITAQRVKEVKGYWTGMFYWGPYVFGLFLLGLYVGRRGILQNTTAHLPLFRKTLWIGLLVGFPLTVVYVLASLSPDLVPGDWMPFVRRNFRVLGGLGLIVFYFSAIILLVQKERWRERLAPLIPVGRMTLTNYLTQSLICTTIFYGYGLALFNRIGPAIGLILSATIFFCQIKFSGWWLDRYRFGPMEWLWRSLTYLKPQPMRLEGDEARLSRRTWLVLAGAVILILAGVLGWWWMNPEDGLPEVAIELPQIQPASQPTATPQATSAPRPTPIGTPVVELVTRDPGSAAARGDLWALGLAFDEEQAFSEIETLTGAPYLGRQAGSREGRAAGDYIAQRFAEYGLRPAGVDGTYFQPFPVLYTSLAATPRLVVTSPGGTTYDYTFRQDYSTLVRYYAGAGTGEGPVIWAHNGMHDDYDGVDAVGKVVLCREHWGQEDQARNALEHGAVGLLLLTDPETRPLDFIGPNREVWVPVPIPVFRVSPAVAQDLLSGTGLPLDDLTLHFASLPLSTTARLEVSLRTDEAAQGRNVLGVLPGRDPAYADQVVIVGGHYDHMGQDPDGTAWVGANDNASGVSVLLEIARSWQEQGYVPRRTVLFAAWDAEEIGLVGSQYYVTHPHYPLTATVGMIQLDMVGAGGDALYIEGSGSLNPKLEAIAHTLGISTTTSTDVGGSDHVPFAQAGVSASLLIWLGVNSADVPDYHRPSDTPAVIEPHKLAAAGRITDLAALALVEGEPGLQDALQARASAVRTGDTDAYLRTSTAARQAFDREQFAALQALPPVQFDVTTARPIIVGNVATTTVQMSVAYIVTANVTTTRVADLPARFIHTDTGWQIDGPALVWEPITSSIGFPVAHSPDRDVNDMGRVAATSYVTITRQLGLPSVVDAAIMLYPSQQALWADTTFPEPSDARVWIGTDGSRVLVKQVYASAVHTDTLVHLAMVRAGVTEETAPWLWRGLPLILRAAADPVATQSNYLPQLVRGLLSTDDDIAISRDVSDWAAVDYLHRRVGWKGIGRLITALGRGQSLDDALVRAVGTDAAGFEAAWRADWKNRLVRAQDGLAALLSARREAVLAGDEAVFLRTVDPVEPALLTEERHWFADLTDHPVEKFALEGQPLALFEDGSLLVSVIMRYQLAGQRESSITLVALLTSTGSGYRWAGPLFETLRGEHVIIRYPAGQEEPARELLSEAEAAYAQIVTDLRAVPSASPTIKLFNDARIFRSSVRLSLPVGVEDWTGPGESLKLLLQSQQSPADRRRVLAQGLTRQFLFQRGDPPEWLREGIATMEASRLDRAAAQQSTGRYRLVVARAAQNDRLFSLAEMPPFLSLSREEQDLAYAQSWDVTRYLVDTYGWGRLRALLQGLGRGQSMDDAFRSALGLPLASFEATWGESAARGHAKPDWVAVASRFAPDAAQTHMNVLASPAYAGRQAGSPGAQAAAQYIADKFATYGLRPVGDDDTYFQHVPISYTTMLAAPRLLLLDRRGQFVGELRYRETFLQMLRGGAGGGTAEGDLVWVKDPTYEGMRLDGKIVLRRPEGTVLAEEIGTAVEHGAGGLILLGKREGERLWAKDPLPVSFPTTRTIPVLEINDAGLEQLLAASGHQLVELNNSPPALPLNLQVRMEVPLSAPVTVSTTNVLGLLPGSDPALRHEVVIVGAHYDHVGDDPDGTRYPGTNDNASGVGVLLEVARLWQRREADYRPARSVLFAAWGAQEAGEVGSSFYVAHPTFSMTDTVAMFQLDAVGGGFGGYRLQLQGSRQREALPLFALETAGDQVEGRLDWGKPVGRSDQRPFRQAGVPAVLLTWRGASEENRPADLADEVDPYKLGVTGRTVTLALMMLARGDVRFSYAYAGPWIGTGQW